MFYLMTHSTHFNDGYVASDIWLRTTEMTGEKTMLLLRGFFLLSSCREYFICTIGQTGYCNCYTSCGALVGGKAAKSTPFRSPNERISFYD